MNIQYKQTDFLPHSTVAKIAFVYNNVRERERERENESSSYELADFSIVSLRFEKLALRASDDNEIRSQSQIRKHQFPIRENQFQDRECRFQTIRNPLLIRNSRFRIRESQFQIVRNEFQGRESQFRVREPRFQYESATAKDAFGSGMFISFQSMLSHFVARVNFAIATFDMTISPNK